MFERKYWYIGTGCTFGSLIGTFIMPGAGTILFGVIGATITYYLIM